MEVIFKAYLLSGIGGDNSPKQRFENIINAIKWPSHVTRLPKNVSSIVYTFYLQLTPSAWRESITQESRRMAAPTNCHASHSLVGLEQ
jgi:hypothetical protein